MTPARARARETDRRSGGRVETIANWLWQGTALALVATILLQSSKRVSATTRYRLWWCTLVMVLCLPAAPSLALLVQALGDVDQPGGLTPASIPFIPAVTDTGSRTLTIPALPRLLLVVTAAVWAGWVVVAGIRAAVGLRALRCARSTARPFPEGRAARLSNWMALRDRGRGCRLAVSESVGSAAVLGPSVPLIAIAPHLLTELTDEELDRIVVHEWAHVQRRDDVGRLIQVAVRAIAGLHPAVWWIDRRLQLEREAACDDWAANLTGSSRGYAACLTKLAAMRVNAPEPVLVPAAIASSDLATRVLRLLDARRSRSLSRRVFATSLLGGSLAAVAVAVASFAIAIDATGAVVLPPVVAPAMGGSGLATPPSRASVDAARRTPPATRVRPQAGSPVRRAPAVEGIVQASAADEPKQAPSAPPDPVPSAPAVAVHGLPPGAMPGVSAVVADGVKVKDPSSPPPSTPWGAAADAGVNIGRGSQKAAVATAGFFSKLGNSIARSF